MDLPKSRSEALACGSSHYFTDAPCKHGHVSKRVTKTGVCYQCLLLAGAKWSAANRDKMAEYARAYRAKNPEEARRKNTEYARRRRAATPKRPPKDRAARTRLTFDVFVARARATHGDRYEYLPPYRGAHNRVSIVCGVHGEFSQGARNHIRGAHCPDCAGASSSLEDKLAAWLETTGVRYERRVRGIIGRKELDFWFPDQKLGVEVHGLWWHTEDKVGDIHAVKAKMAVEAGIRLVQLFEDDLLGRWDACTGRLSSLLGIQDRVPARKTICRKATVAEIKPFLDRWHLQGAGQLSGIYYGLWLSDELVAVMTFGAARDGSTAAKPVAGQYELMRFSASKTVTGGFSKLLAAFVRDYRPEKIVSFSDMLHSDGAVYRKNGFELVSTSTSQYWWLPKPDAKKRVQRYQTQKHRLRDHEILGRFYRPDWSETDICRSAGWLKILGVGNQRWELRFNNNPEMAD